MNYLFSKPLADCRRVFISNYLAIVKIGIYDKEKAKAQPMRFNVDLYIPIQHATSENDSIKDVINYEWLLSKLKEIIFSEKHIHLQETLCDQLIAAFLTDQRVLAACVRCEKLKICEPCEAIGVERFQFNTSVCQYN